MARFIRRLALLALAASMLSATALTAPAAASTARAASSCSGFTQTVLATGAKVSQLSARGMSCASARKMASTYLTHIDSSDGRFVFNCAPPAGGPVGHCSLGHYRMTARGVSGAQAADIVTCRHGHETARWRVDFDQQDGSAP